MGYTHYWDNGGFDDDQWKKALIVTKTIIRYANCPVQFDFDEPQPPELDDESIRFNGVEDDGHETFMILKDGSDSWNFCKTARKPYDDVVVAVLILLAKLNPAFTWSSDGNSADHKAGRDLYNRAVNGL